MHAYQKAAAMPVLSGPIFDLACEMSPAAKVEVTNAEVGTLGYGERLLERRE